MSVEKNALDLAAMDAAGKDAAFRSRGGRSRVIKRSAIRLVEVPLPEDVAELLERRASLLGVPAESLMSLYLGRALMEF